VALNNPSRDTRYYGKSKNRILLRDNQTGAGTFSAELPDDLSSRPRAVLFAASVCFRPSPRQ
jgi:hypothetical protein